MDPEVTAIVTFMVLGLVQLPGAVGLIDVDSPGWAWFFMIFFLGIALAIALNGLVQGGY